MFMHTKTVISCDLDMFNAPWKPWFHSPVPPIQRPGAERWWHRRMPRPAAPGDPASLDDISILARYTRSVFIHTQYKYIYIYIFMYVYVYGYICIHIDIYHTRTHDVP